MLALREGSKWIHDPLYKPLIDYQTEIVEDRFPDTFSKPLSVGLEPRDTFDIK